MVRASKTVALGKLSLHDHKKLMHRKIFHFFLEYIDFFTAYVEYEFFRANRPARGPDSATYAADGRVARSGRSANRQKPRRNSPCLPETRHRANLARYRKLRLTLTMRGKDKEAQLAQESFRHATFRLRFDQAQGTIHRPS
jgi:hypothetical protein